MLEPYGLVVVLLGLAMAVYTFRGYRRGSIGLPTFLVWTAIWVGLMLTGVYPQMYLIVTSTLGMATPIQFVTTFSIIVLFGIVYQLYRIVGEVNRKITRIVQHLALQSSEKDVEQLVLGD